MLKKKSTYFNQEQYELIEKEILNVAATELANPKNSTDEIVMQRLHNCLVILKKIGSEVELIDELERMVFPDEA